MTLNWTERFLLVYASLPEHAMKWRIVSSLVKRCPHASQFKAQIKRMGVCFDVDCSNNTTDFLLTWFGACEKEELAIFKKYIKSGMTVIDAGANIGLHTLMSAKLTGPKGIVYAFEPNHITRQRLEANLKLNNTRNAKIITRAVSNKSNAGFLTSRGELGHAHLINLAGNAEPTLQGEEVNCVTLDDFAAEQKLERIDFIKVDIEGYEPNLIQGAQASLKKFKPIMLIEVNRKTLIRNNWMPSGLLNLIAQAGFSVRNMKEQLIQCSDFTRFDNQDQHENILAIPI